MGMTTIALGSYYENFIESKISQGRYSNASEVIQAALRLLEEDEKQIIALKEAVNEGINSGIAENFDPQEFLRNLKAAHANGSL